MTFETLNKLERPDDFYEALIDAHRDLDDAQSEALNARLILVLANAVGEHATLMSALRLAKGLQ
ncbi:DUF2783 domain-containing protein [Ralstonia sp. 25C]|uniref:DUF2783 domain-containing protein n=1 Tax=Ralstonia sp. 25C TaxID=3447363 RepID=UPI003F7546DF